MESIDLIDANVLTLTSKCMSTLASLSRLSRYDATSKSITYGISISIPISIYSSSTLTWIYGKRIALIWFISVAALWLTGLNLNIKKAFLVA